MKSILPILLIGASIGIFMLFTDSEYQKVKAIQLEIADYEKAISKSREVLAKRQSLADKYKLFSNKDLESVKKLLPEHVDNIQLVLDVNGIARKKGMSLKSIKIDEEKVAASSAVLGTDKKPYSTILVSFKVSSPYENFSEFLLELEQSLRIVDVTALSFRANDKGVYDYNVTIRTYWLK